MPKKSLKQTNPYLKDKAMRLKIVEIVTVSSSAIEGTHTAAKRALKKVSSGGWSVRSAQSGRVVSRTKRT
jgi:hypothetical protein